MSRRPTVSPLAGALSLALALPALAEPAPGPTELDRVEVHGQRDSYRADASRTATRTDTPLIDVPQSISVVTEEMIDDTAMRGLADVVQYVPGTGIAQGEGHRDAPVLRGNTSTADMFVDGMRDDMQYFRDLYNVERVEVLKGPNAMTFGRGGTGGVINRVTKQADWNTTRELKLQVGSWDRRRATVDVGKAVSDAFAFRVTGLYEDSENFRDAFELERWGINPSFAFRLGENTHLHVDAEHFEDRRVTDRGVPSYAVAFEGRRYPVATDRSTYFGAPGLSPSEFEMDAVNVLFEHEFGNGALLRNRTRYARYDKFYQNVFAGGPLRTGPAGTPVVALSAYSSATERENLFNQTDLIFSAQTGAVKHTVLAGLEFGRQDSENFRQTGAFPSNLCYNGNGAFSATTAAFCVPVANPRYTGAVTFANNGSSDANNTVEARIAAAYVQDQIEFSPQWQAVLGVRFDRFEIDFRNRQGGGQRITTEDDLWSPRAGLIFKPLENLALYASYGITYLPRAGEQMGSLSASNRAFDPEEYENYEIGAKWDVRRDLVLTAAVFRLHRDNVIQPDPANPTRSILGEGERIEGVELGISGQITDAWRVMGGYAWQDGEILFGADRGRTPANLAGQTASLWNRYDFNAQWGVGLGAIYRSAIHPQASNAVTLRSFTRYDAALYYTPSQHVQLQLNVENLFDKRYFVSAHNDNNLSPGSPRAAYLSVTLSF
ncbi:MAG TPA: TonB-dependent siderophore receptor [Lysobacter sp.]|nr:TonB-dependent siderophore receptor [Lysobacter sp.]